MDFESKPEVKNGRKNMNDQNDNPNNLVDTTDCLEAMGVFRGWKNFFFVITLIGLLLVQVGFWMVDRGIVKTQSPKKPPQAEVKKAVDQSQTNLDKISSAAEGAVDKVANPETEKDQPKEDAQINESKTDDSESDQKQQEKKKLPKLQLGINHIIWSIRTLNFIIIPTSILFFLSMLFCLKISIVGRFGGINHIARAFFLSLILMVMLLPWQMFFNNIFTSVLFTPAEILREYAAVSDTDTAGVVLYYLRFSAYWLLAVLLLIFAQAKSSKWAKATLRRLEVI